MLTFLFCTKLYRAKYNKLKELDSDIISNENINNSRIIEHGNIIEYVEMKVNDGYESANWVENIVPKLNIYILNVLNNMG